MAQNKDKITSLGVITEAYPTPLSGSDWRTAKTFWGTWQERCGFFISGFWWETGWKLSFPHTTKPRAG